MLYTHRDISQLVNQWGFLPFFAGEIEGFSVEENITPDRWFPEGDGEEGVWEWKNEIIMDADCAYGKFYMGKACFVSMQWFPDLVNVRRNTYRPTADEELILHTVKENGSLLSREIKKLCGYTAPPRRRAASPLERMAAADAPRPKAERKGFDSAITRLQMGCQLLSATFEYNYTKEGRRYGWSIARYCTPEDYFGSERIATPLTPEQSRARLLDHLAATLPQATEKQICNIVGL